MGSCGRIQRCCNSSRLVVLLPFFLVIATSVAVWANSSADLLCQAFGSYCIAGSESAAHVRSVSPPVPLPGSRSRRSGLPKVGRTGGSSSSGNRALRTVACQRATANASGEPAASTLRFVNAGLGTTGTHGIHRHYCKVGLPAAHWRESCNLSKSSFRSHSRVLMWYSGQINCVTKKSRQAKCKTANALREFRVLLAEVASSSVAALSDVPYYYFLDDVLSCAPHVRVALTLRDPKEWATNRLKHHGGDLICKQSTGWNGSCYDLAGCCGPASEFVHHCWTLDRLYDKAGELSECGSSHERYVRSRVPADQLTPMSFWSDDVAIESALRAHTHGRGER